MKHRSIKNEYCSLRDNNLQEYNSNPRLRRHLIKTGVLDQHHNIQTQHLKPIDTSYQVKTNNYLLKNVSSVHSTNNKSTTTIDIPNKMQRSYQKILPAINQGVERVYANQQFCDLFYKKNDQMFQKYFSHTPKPRTNIKLTNQSNSKLQQSVKYANTNKNNLVPISSEQLRQTIQTMYKQMN